MTLTGGHSSRKYWRVSYIMIASSTFAHKQHCLTEPMQRSVAQNVFNQHITLPERRMGKKLTPRAECKPQRIALLCVQLQLQAGEAAAAGSAPLVYRRQQQRDTGVLGQ